jgi:fermentation-respiration switch protein FrsA (DUF1100 family)
LLLLLNSSCNHLFYFPDSEKYADPSALNLAYEDIRLESSDGIWLSGWRLAAKGTPKGTILHFHGNAQNMTAHFFFVVWLVEYGFDVITFDYRGYGQSEGSITRAGSIEDAVAFLQYAKKHAQSQTAGNLFLIGQSLGGAIATVAAAKEESKAIRGLILDSTFASYRGIAKDKLADFWLTWPLQWPLSFLISDDLSPEEAIPNLHVPLLFFHSPLDPAVPYRQGQRLYAHARGDKIWVDVTEPGHTGAFASEDDSYRQTTLAFLCQHLVPAQDDCPKQAPQEPTQSKSR